MGGLVRAIPWSESSTSYLEGVLVLNEIDLSDTFGHQVAGAFSFEVIDDGDGVITLVLEHGDGPENPLLNGIEVKNLVTTGTAISGDDAFYRVEVTNPGSNGSDATITGITDTINLDAPIDLAASCPDIVTVLAPGATVVCRVRDRPHRNDRWRVLHRCRRCDGHLPRVQRRCLVQQRRSHCVVAGTHTAGSADGCRGTRGYLSGRAHLGCQRRAGLRVVLGLPIDDLGHGYRWCTGLLQV